MKLSHYLNKWIDPILLGYIIGISIGFPLIHGGYDGYYFYLRQYFVGYQIPIWGYYFLRPFSLFIWPVSAILLNLISLFTLFIFTKKAKLSKWIFLSTPIIGNTWLGQTEILSFLCVIGILLVLDGRLNKKCSFFVILLGMLKPQVTIFITIFFIWRMAKEYGIRWLFLQLYIILGIISLTSIPHPDWLINWLRVIVTYNYSFNNQYHWYCILALLFVFLPMKTLQGRLSLLVMLNCFVVPNFQVYRIFGIMPFVGSFSIMLVTWILRENYYGLLFIIVFFTAIYDGSTIELLLRWWDKGRIKYDTFNFSRRRI